MNLLSVPKYLSEEHTIRTTLWQSLYHPSLHFFYVTSSVFCPQAPTAKL
jgi:hypothetical protein